MVGAIIAFISCMMCAAPFFIIGKFDRNSKTPISFWSGDKSLMDKVKKVDKYNEEMGDLYITYAKAFALAGVGFLLNVILGTVLLALDCTVGIYVVYRKYKEILKRYS